MAKCKQLTPLSFKELMSLSSESPRISP